MLVFWCITFSTNEWECRIYEAVSNERDDPYFRDNLVCSLGELVDILKLCAINGKSRHILPSERS